MDNTEDTTPCPISGNNHKFYVYQQKAEFEPAGLNEDGVQLYIRTEVATFFCNCAHSFRKPLETR